MITVLHGETHMEITEMLANNVKNASEEQKEKEFEERILAYLAKENPGYFGGDIPDDEMECEYNNPELWTSDCNFVFTADGVRLLPLFPHYKAPCLDPEWSVIPYLVLKDLVKPEAVR